MYEFIKRFFAWLLPLIKDAAAVIIAEEVEKFVFAKTDRPTPRTTYRRGGYIPPQNRTRPPESTVNKIRRDAGMTAPEGYIKGFDVETSGTDYHDVIMVAFDITARSQNAAYEWLADNMPTAENYKSFAGDINLDSWWIADDNNTFSDCDSAVFVHKGNQAVARHILRTRGLS